MPHGANTGTNTTNETQPKQNFGKNFTKMRTPTPFSKNPKFQNPKLKSAKFKTKVKTMFRKTYLEEILQRFLLENDGV